MKSRVGRLFRSSLGALFSPAEDPRRAFAEPSDDQLDLLRQLSATRLRLIEARGRLETLRGAVTASGERSEREARVAVAVGRDDVARAALRLQRFGEAEVSACDRQIERLLHEERQLAGVEQRIRGEAETARLREELVAAQRVAAQSQIAAVEALTSIALQTEHSSMLERFELDTEELQARADAIRYLAEAGILDSAGERSEIAPVGDLDGDAGCDVESRLAALKREEATWPA